MNIYDIIIDAINSQGLTVTSAVEKCGLANGITTKIKNRKTLTTDTLHKLAIGLDIPSIDPYGEHQQSSEFVTLETYYNKLTDSGKQYALNKVKEIFEAETAAELTPNQIKIKHGIFKASAGTGCSVWEQDAFEEILVDKTYYSTQADFCLTISGNSMQPVYQDGDIVLVKSQNDIEIGEIGIFIKGNQGYIKSKGFDRLISLNKNYPDIMQSEYDDIMCVGRVIGKL